MFAFAVYGEDQVKALLPGVQKAVTGLRADARVIGIETEVKDFGGARDETIVTQLLAWRDANVAKGRPWYRVSPFKNTYHARGGAIDLKVTARPAGMSLTDAYAALGKIAPRHGLVWGGTFKPVAGQTAATSLDPYHFQSAQSLDRVTARWNEWVKSPEFPRRGAAELAVIVALVVLALVFLFLRSR